MYEFKNIKNLWKNADNQTSDHESFDADAVKTAIAYQSHSITSKLLRTIRTGIFSFLLCASLFGYNIYGYTGNSLIVTLSISCLVLSTLLITFLSFQYRKLSNIDQAVLSLHDILVSKIKYFKGSLNIVNHTIALGIVLLIFSLNLAIENNSGNYYVNNVWLDITLKVVAYIFMIVILKLSQNLYLKQYEIALSYLEKTKLTEMDTELRKHRWIKRLLFTIALLIVVVGLIVFYMNVSG